MVYLVILTISCDDIVKYNDGYDDGTSSSGPPSVTKITTIDNQEFPIDKSQMDKVVLIHGINLSKVKSIYFNDREADFTEIYAIKSMIGVRIPAIMPLDINNQIKIITEKGETTYPFEVEIPQLVISGVSNEFAAAKDTISITGRYFDLYNITMDKAVVTLNSTPVSLLEATSTSLKLEVPSSGNLDNSVISVSSDIINRIFGKAFEIPFHNKGTFTIIDFKIRDTGNKDALMSDGTAPGDPKPLIGGEKFLRIKNHNTDAWGGWIDLSWTYMEPIPNESKYADLLANPANYYLKFEILTNNPINAAKLRFAIGSPLTWTEKDYQWGPAGSGVPFNTNKKWQTVTIDCASFIGLPPLNVGTYNDWGNIVGANFLVINFIPQGHSEKVDFSYTNLRFVKK